MAVTVAPCWPQGLGQDSWCSGQDGGPAWGPEGEARGGDKGQVVN